MKSFFNRYTPFLIEEFRTFLATKGNYKALRQTYRKENPEIPDLNSSIFWNKRLPLRAPLNQQDGMTQQRTKTAAHFLPKTVKKVLDIGIGHGWVEELLEKRNIKLYGTDISDCTIKNIKKRFHGTFWVESIYHLTSKKTIYDAILLLEVLEHIPPSKTLNILKKINNSLTRNGYFIISVPTNEGLETMSDNPSGHVRTYTLPLIKAELEISGFKILKLKTLYAFKKIYLLKQFLAFFWRNKWQPNNIIILAQKK